MNCFSYYLKYNRKKKLFKQHTEPANITIVKKKPLL